MALVLDWIKKLRYTKNPFEPVLFTPVSGFVVGLNTGVQERFNLFLIKDDRFGTVTGDKGTGKTTFLRWMDEALDPQKSHIQHYLDTKDTGRRDEITRSLLNSRLSFFERQFGKTLKLPPQERENALLQKFAQEERTVILIDNAGSLGKTELDFFSTIITKTPTHVIFADTEERIKKLNLNDTFVDKLKIKTPEYTSEQLIELLRKRIESVGGRGTFPFNEQELIVLTKKAEKNPLKLFAAAKDRAIELSLRVREVPRQVQQSSLSTVPITEKKIGFLNIRFEKPGEKQNQNTSNQNTSDQNSSTNNSKMINSKDVEKQTLATQTEDTAVSEVASALAGVIQEAEHPKKALKKEAPKPLPPPPSENFVISTSKKDDLSHQSHHKTKYDKTVEKLAEEFKKHPPKLKQGKKKL